MQPQLEKQMKMHQRQMMLRPFLADLMQLVTNEPHSASPPKWAASWAAPSVQLAPWASEGTCQLGKSWSSSCMLKG